MGSMEAKYNFKELKIEIVKLTYKQQLKRLVEARTEFKQTKNPMPVYFKTQVPFDQKCDLEIDKIRELMKIEAL